jgi:NAD(P) transhydrogenase
VADPQHFDILVIGSGPGGEGAAMQAVKHGKQVAVIERFERIGGGCRHWGTIPSKALRYAIYQMTEANQNPLFHAAEVSLRVAHMIARVADASCQRVWAPMIST